MSEKNIICATRGDVPSWVAEETFAALTNSFNRGGAFPAPKELEIEWRGSPNYWAGRGGQAIVGICDHIMQSSIESADGWFRNAGSEASAHFGVARDGRIYQWVRIEDSAWTNGIVNKPDLSVGWLADAIRRGINPNTLTIGIEHEGLSGQPFTEIQTQRTIALQRWICQTYDIEPNRVYLIGHNQIDGVNRLHCPGDTYPWTRLISSLQNNLQTGVTKLINPVEGVDGKSYWIISPIREYWERNQWLGLPLDGMKSLAEANLPGNGVVQNFQRGRVEVRDGQVPELGLVNQELFELVRG